MKQSGAGGLAPEVLGGAVAKALTTPKPKVRYSVAPDPITTFLTARLPRRLVDRVLGKRMGLIPS